MTDTKIRVPFGLNDAIPETAEVAWGARFIITQDGHVDLPPDRQGFSDSPQDLKEDLLSLMNRYCPLGRVRDAIRDLLVDGVINTREAEQHTLYDDHGLKVVGNSNGSAGYLYVAAWVTT